MGSSWRGVKSDVVARFTRQEAPQIVLIGRRRGAENWVWVVEHPDLNPLLLGYLGPDHEFASMLADHVFPPGGETNPILQPEPKRLRPDRPERIATLTVGVEQLFLGAIRFSLVASVALDQNGTLVFRSESGQPLLTVYDANTKYTNEQLREVVNIWREFHCGGPNPDTTLGKDGTERPYAPAKEQPAADPTSRLREIVEEHATPAEGTLTEDGTKDAPQPLPPEVEEEVRKSLKAMGLNLPDTIVTKPQGEES